MFVLTAEMVQQSFEGVQLGSHLLVEVAHVGVVDHLQSLIQLFLIAHGRHLQAALDLLPDLLEAVDQRHRVDVVHALQRLVADVRQAVLSCHFAVVYDRLQQNKFLATFADF